MTEAVALLAEAPASRLALGSRAYLALVPGLVVAVLLPHRLGLVLLYDLVVLALFAWDAWRLSRARVRVSRELEARLRVRTAGEYTLTVHNESSLALRLWVRDTAPTAFVLTPALHAHQLAAGESSQLSQGFVAEERGRGHFGDLHVRRESGLGLAARLERTHSPMEVRVLPEASREAARAQVGPRKQLGDVAERLRRASQGSELESLREYVAGDPLRAINWKATAKRRHPVTRLYQPERSQTLWFVLDASRTMAASLGEDGARRTRTRYDVALEALLVVADGALRAGDQVGALVVGDGLERVVPPGRGRAQYRRLLDTLSMTDAAQVRLDVRTLVGELERRAQKRALVVLFTDLENEVHGEALCERAHLLTRRHLVLCVSLDDSITRTLADSTTSEGDEAVFLRAAAIDMLRERTELVQRLEKKHVHVLQADEKGLSAATLDHYLRIKTRALL